ncbi:MAG: SMP-30/gluconolactonase/LRE family protein [Litorimonas sp.]
MPISPMRWQPPKDLRFTGDFKANQRLAELERLPIGDNHGPEDAALWQGLIYTVSQNGNIIGINPLNQSVTILANTGGVPLGVEVNPKNNHLILADAYKGLLSISPSGQVSTLTNMVDGSPIQYADDIDIADDGMMYFSDASTKFGAKAIGNTLAASLLELMEHGSTGRLLAYNPTDKSTHIVATGFAFANGVAIHPDGDVLLLETGAYSLHKINPQTGAKRTILSNLPGFPDNINRGPDLANGKASYFIGLISPRSDWLDKNATQIGARKFAMRLPAFMRPKAVPYVHIVHIDEDGTVLTTFQDPKGSYHEATGAVVIGDYIYITSLTETSLARRPYPIH